MAVGLDLHTLFIGILIFAARITDVSTGTIRTISIIHGRTKSAFFLGLIEVSMWLVVISTVLNQIAYKPILGFFYAFGFSAGNVVGIVLERRLAFGHMVLRVISSCRGDKMAEEIRECGYAVTTFRGEGMCGPVTELYIVCRRKELKELTRKVEAIEPGAFYITEQAGNVSKVYQQDGKHSPRWRGVLRLLVP